MAEVPAKSCDGIGDQVRLTIEAFAGDPRASALSLAGLGLTELPPNMPELLGRSLDRVERLDLARNNLTTLPNWLSRLPNLRILFLLKNPISVIPSVLRDCSSLFMLSFKSCALAGPLDDTALPPRLGWLILTDNAITSLSETFGERARHVRKLLLANNRLTTLPANMMTAGMSGCLELLRLNNNLLEEVPGCIFEAEKLAWLGLGGNPCSSPSVRSVGELDQSARVDLSSFRICDGPPLGSGASGEVRLATKEGDGKKYAIKFYKGSVTSDGAALDEVRAALQLRGLVGLIPVHGFFSSADGSDAGLVMDVVTNLTELANPPSFATVSRDVYDEEFSFDSAEDAHRLLLFIAMAAEKMHERGWSHGDLYGHNILVPKGRGAVGGRFLSDLGASFEYSDPRIELVEVRAFGILIAEVLDHIRAPGSSSDIDDEYSRLRRISKSCMENNVMSRPRFGLVRSMLKELRF